MAKNYLIPTKVQLHTEEVLVVWPAYLKNHTNNAINILK